MSSYYSEILNKEFERNGSKCRITELPNEKKPTPESLKQLSRKIEAQVNIIKVNSKLMF